MGGDGVGSDEVGCMEVMGWDLWDRVGGRNGVDGME